jgi:23S rRNA pseudouridine1911/1915/1917 synthase
LVDEGLVLVNGQVEKKRYKVALLDEVEVEFPLETSAHLLAQDIPLDILFEDEHLLVVNKPASMVVHPGAGQVKDTLANALAFRGIQNPLAPHRPGIVHRLDKDTSGVIVTAKHALAHSLLVEAFASRQVEKIYAAIACKHEAPFEISAPIARDPNQRQKMAVVASGKPALSRFKTVATSGGDWPLFGLKIHLLTGRTHQIRVHLRHQGAPILGDKVYGWSAWNDHFNINRQMLHAYSLALEHPITKKSLRFEAPLPEDMAELWQIHLGAFDPKAFLGAFS